MPPASLPFTKMHGLGNDFVMLEGKHLNPAWPLEKLAAYLCDRRFGVGADGLIVVMPPSDPVKFDLKFVYLNSDGSWAEMCGNGIRCFARFVKDLGYTTKDRFVAETLAGPIIPQVNADHTVTVDMGAPIFEPALIPFADPTADTPVLNYPLPVLGQNVPVSLVSMGNPHCLIFQDDLAAPLDPAVFGPAMETHPSFPRKTNVEFLEVKNQHHIKVTVWERGCGFTLACGTGACASAVGAILLGKTAEEVDVELPGGPLRIHWDRKGNGHVMMTGPAAYVFKGTVDVPESVLQAAVPA